LVAAAVVAALADIRERSEDVAQKQLARMQNAFKGTLNEQLNQLMTLTKSIEGARFDVAITKAVEAKEYAALRQQLQYLFELVRFTPDFYELRDDKDQVILRKSANDAGTPGPAPKWTKPVLTEFDREPMMAVRFDQFERGTLVIGRNARQLIRNLKDSFGIDVALVGASGVVDSTLPGWTLPMGTSGTVFVDGKRFLAARDE